MLVIPCESKIFYFFVPTKNLTFNHFNRNLKKIILFSICSSFFIINLFSSFLSTDINNTPINEEEDQTTEIITPRSADSAITIIDPENITYNGVLSGHYVSTFNFYGDEVGTFPMGWIQAGSGPFGGDTKVVSSKNGHNKVVFIDDDQGDTAVTPYQDFTAEQTSGTVELWIYFGAYNPPNHDYVAIRIENSSGVALTNIFAYDNNLRYSNGTNTIITGLNAINEWFHVTIDFSGDGTYKTLYANTYNFTFHQENGNLYYQSPIVNYSTNSIGNAARFKVLSNTAMSRDTWFDSVGYSWEPSYNIGDNWNEGILLSYTNTTSLNWMGYSMDGQANITLPQHINGTHLLRLPQDGTHTIQLFGNETDGTMHSSEKRYFIIDTINPTININSPNLHDLCGKTAPSFNVDFTDTNLDVQWYSIDGGINNITFTGSIGEIDQSLWEVYGNGTVTIRFFANDTGGNENFSEITVLKDTIQPVLEIISPYMGSEYIDPPIIKLSINETNQYSVWYTLDGGLTNYPYTGIGLIDQDAWDAASSGQITITFYVRDIVGNEVLEEIIIVKISIAEEGSTTETTEILVNDLLITYIIIFSTMAIIVGLIIAIYLKTMIPMKRKIESMERSIKSSKIDSTIKRK